MVREGERGGRREHKLEKREREVRAGMRPTGQRTEEGINGDAREVGVIEGIEETGGEEEAMGHPGIEARGAASEKERLDDVEEGRREALWWRAGQHRVHP